MHKIESVHVKKMTISDKNRGSSMKKGEKRVVKMPNVS